MTGGKHVSWPLVRFSIIGEAWRLYKDQWVLWSLTMLISLVGYGVVNGILYEILGDRPRGAGRGLVNLVSIMATGFLLGGMIRMATKQIRGLVPTIEDLFSVTDVWFDVLLCSFLSTLASAISVGFCLLPGMIVSGLFMLGMPLVVEARLPATGALIQSWNVLKAQWLTATVFHTALIVIVSTGLVVCGVGVLATGPIYSISLAILYHEFFPGSGKAAWEKRAELFPEI